ncbi:MAG: rhodanese-like domain-containing protein [Thermodesulfobacteriota bacterium]|nr:rhodanese-like domain-containing protein [Thermodesulfobacteriota bacterium]
MHSKDAARLAAKMGYGNVLVYSEGIPGWLKNGHQIEATITLPKVKIPQIAPNELKKKMAAGEVYLVDTRGEERKKTGVIPGTNTWLSDMDILDKYASLPKDKPLVVYDTADKKALTAARFLHDKGYTSVTRLGGGILKWIGSGFPVEKIN